ncbi:MULTISPECIES: putative bifunctional diguanylate cyclase/phosphodiesterase [unclassified Sphingomonas]|uniref:putative bifunctional diguanylate cyclase/phosphodiesterase n=1 Tax=unclassified Sphingomonas TaxID=196159 RepID=UPI00082AA157|nr:MULTISPECIES: EAL domain-containing protein [unclassified Sphingomonas]
MTFYRAMNGLWAIGSSPDLVAAQYRALRSQIPLMYALMLVDTAFLAAATFHDVPLALSIGAPILLAVLATCRALVWLKRPDAIEDNANIRRYLRGTVVVAAILSTAFGGWGLVLMNVATPEQMLAIALYIFVGAIGCCYCLQALPAAARMVLLLGAAPVTVRLLLSHDWYLFGIGINFILVAALIGKMLSRYHDGYMDMLNSRSEILAEQARAQTAERRAQQLAYRDVLTELPNRRALIEHLADLRLLPSGRALALLVLDLDHFKAVNDVHGHHAGDELLERVAECLTEIVADSGTAYRLGGDEFAITLDLDRADSDAPETLAQRIVSTLAAPFWIDGLVHHIGGSIGISLYPRDATDSDTLMRRADIALYQAKAAGRSQFRMFERAMDAAIVRRSVLEQEFRRDLEQGAFRPHYQPIVHLESEEITGFEMLARWKRDDGTDVGPCEFIPIAEECGLVGELMLNLLEQACIDATAWGPGLTLSINVSPTQLKDRWLSEKILRVLTKAGLPPQRLKLEITENALIAEPAHAKLVVESLKNQGVLLALDDFGTGYSSIQHLRILPFDNVKIDRSFITGIEHDAEAHRMAVSIIHLAFNLGLTVVAEGVESAGVLNILKEIGCAEGQGYFFGRPVSQAGALALLEGSREVTDGSKRRAI